MKSVMFRPGALTARLQERAGGPSAPSPALVAKRDLGRWYTMLMLGRHEIRGRFTRDELCLVTDVCIGPVWDDASWQTLWAEVADAVRLARGRGLPESTSEARWGLTARQADDLVRRLQGLSWAGKAALADCVERFWLEPDRDAADAVLAEIAATD